MYLVLDFTQIEQNLTSEIKLSSMEAKAFLLITTKGKMSAETIAKELDLTVNEALRISKKLMDLGAFIDISKTEFEAMHPRFTIVNMYRRMCERENIEFKRNKIVDNIGVFLERPYDAARTK